MISFLTFLCILEGALSLIYMFTPLCMLVLNVISIRIVYFLHSEGCFESENTLDTFKINYIVFLHTHLSVFKYIFFLFSILVSQIFQRNNHFNMKEEKTAKKIRLF